MLDARSGVDAKVREAVQTLLSIVYEQAATMTSQSQEMPRQFAAAGLLRCCALLRGIRVLEDTGLAALTGILARQLWETWLLSLHVLIRGVEALRQVAGDDVYWKRLLSGKLDLGLAYQDDWDGPKGKLNWKTLADELKPLLLATGEEGDPDGSKGYDSMYRVQSLFAVHAGLATFQPYLFNGDPDLGLVPNPAAPFPRVERDAALYTAHLANHVFKRFARPTEGLHAIWSILVEGNQDNPGGSLGAGGV